MGYDLRKGGGDPAVCTVGVAFIYTVFLDERGDVRPSPPRSAPIIRFLLSIAFLEDLR